MVYRVLRRSVWNQHAASLAQLSLPGFPSKVSCVLGPATTGWSIHGVGGIWAPACSSPTIWTGSAFNCWLRRTQSPRRAKFIESSRLAVVSQTSAAMGHGSQSRPGRDSQHRRHQRRPGCCTVVLGVSRTLIRMMFEGERPLDASSRRVQRRLLRLAGTNRPGWPIGAGPTFRMQLRRHGSGPLSMQLEDRRSASHTYCVLW